MGHQDFYPNGGEFQNGCNYFEALTKQLDFQNNIGNMAVQTFACSHFRGIHYYAESLKNFRKCRFNFWSVPCENYG